ncbi:PAS domain S-box protein [Chloroflexota bacterium]
MQRPLISRLASVIRKPGFWLLVSAFLLITFFQYAESLGKVGFLAHLTTNLGLTRYTLERILYLLPIIWAGILFGLKGGIVTSTISVATMLPRAILISPSREDALVETIAVFIVGNLVAFSLQSLRDEKERRSELEAAQQELQGHLRVIEENEKRLAALNQTSAIVSQSLELADVLDAAVTCVMDVMKGEIILIYILDEGAKELAIASHRGISEEFASELVRIKVGEGFNGRVAETGEPLFVEDSSRDPRLTKMALRSENIRSQLIVPLICKGKVVGTLCVAMREHRRFLPQEVDLLTAIGNQIGVAVENARLYQQEREVAEQLRSSEQRYRGLFENAHDAIWLHALKGNIIAANKACVRLTGYDFDELRNLKMTDLISGDSFETARSIEEDLLRGESPGSLGELKLIKKDRTEAFIQLASSLVYGNGRPMALQCIARDVTATKRMEENLRFFLQHITRAQEEERTRIAHELHDDTLQALVVHSNQIDELASDIKRLRKHDITQYLEELHDRVNDIMQGVRRLSQDLRPAALDQLGLLPALEWLISNVADYSGIEMKVKVLGVVRRLSNEVELVLFRIAQEALRNVWKHAQATSAEIMVEFEESKIRIKVKDNGRGFSLPHPVTDLPRSGKLGLAGMRERSELLGGILTVESEPGKGATIIAELPV